MIISLLCEQRSGSTNLANWFYFNKKFTTLFEPLDPKSKWFQNNINDYRYSTDNLCIKETYYPHINWDDLIKISDKLILLYRDDYQLQLESFLNSVTTNNWDGEYVFNVNENLIVSEKEEYFKTLKTEFKEKYLDKEFFKISYEELYYNNGFQKIVDYIDLDYVKNEKFPYGKKYRINAVVNKLI